MVSIGQLEKFLGANPTVVADKEAVLREARDVADARMVSAATIERVLGPAAGALFTLVTTDPEYMRVGLQDARSTG